MAYSDTENNSSRAIGFVIVLVIHVMIFYAFQSGLARQLVELAKGPLETKIIDEIKPDKEAPPPPPPKFQAPPPPPVIMPEINIEAPPAPTDNAITAAPARQAPKVETASVTVAPRSNPRRPVTQPEYPPASKRLGEVGTVVLLLTVSEDGKVLEAKVDKSSGYDRLDQAAVQEALRSWRLLPGTINGKPTQMQGKLAVTFKLTD